VKKFENQMSEGGKKPTIQDAVKSIKWSELSMETIAQVPCARSALITGISGGTTLGLARFFGTSIIRLIRE
jgi:3-dehydroquinate synthetase